MSNKPMLSVERELIQRIADHCKFWIDHPYLEAIADVEVELRAILDKEVDMDSDASKQQGEPVYMVRSHGSDCWEEMSGESLEMCRVQPAEYEVRKLYAEPVAQHQVEPIKLSDDVREFLQEWLDSSTGGEDEDIDYDFANQLGLLLGPIYAEPPAPVAVVMPEDWEDQLFAEMSRRFDLRKQIDDDHMVYDDTQIGVEFARDWIKSRLNEVKP